MPNCLFMEHWNDFVSKLDQNCVDGSQPRTLVKWYKYVKYFTIFSLLHSGIRDSDLDNRTTPQNSEKDFLLQTILHLLTFKPTGVATPLSNQKINE